MSRRLPRPAPPAAAGGRALRPPPWVAALSVVLLLGPVAPPTATGLSGTVLPRVAAAGPAGAAVAQPPGPHGGSGAPRASAPAPRRRLDASRWRLPVWPTRVTRAFANPPHDWLPGHRGVDLRGVPGEPVRAAGAGRVTFAATLAGRGVVVVDHGELRTTYEPVEALVLPGQHVGRGEVLGVLAPGTGHCGTGLCLHLGLRRGRAYLDPMLLFGSPRALLRPW